MTTVLPGAMNACDELLRPTPNDGRGRSHALIYRDTAYTYDDLEAMVNRLGNALLAAGIGRGERILLMLKDSPEFVSCYLAAMKIGGVPVAISTRCAPKDLRFVIDDSGCRVLFIDSEFLGVYTEAGGGQQGSRPLVVVRGGNAVPPAITLAAFAADQPDRLDSTLMLPEDMAFWIYTSGTTGTPKAAVHRHHEVLLGDRYIGEVLGVKPGNRLYSSSKLFFAFALGHCLLGGLRVGATLILHDGWPDSASVAETARRYRPDFMFSVPTVYRNLLRDGHAESGAFDSVRCFVSAGEQLPASLFERWRAMTGRPILEGIGATETIFLTIANTPSAYRAGSTGRPQPGVDLRLLDEHNRPIAEPGRPGVLWVRIGSLCSGYWNQAEKTQSSFCDGWFRTGDAFSFDAEGWWYHLGRSDDLLKVSGQWVSPIEIEDCALGVPDIVDAAVVGVPNSDGLVRLAMFVVPADFDARDGLAMRLQERIKSQLSIYKCPRNITFIREIPRTATGKVQRFRLRELASQAA
jgi:3-hydroxybenzoate/4-hydroxybenzoate---CoA ligase